MARPPTSVEAAVNRLATDINRGVYRPGAWLPPRRTLCVTLGVSKSTVGRALEALAECGLVEIHGLRGAKVTMTIPHKSGYERAMTLRRTGRIYEPGEYATIKEVGLADAPPDVANALGIDSGAQAIRRYRITHNADGTIESVSTSWYDGALADVAPRLLSDERIPEGSWAYLEARTGRRAVAGTETFEARMVTEEEASDLQIAFPSAVKVATLVLRDADGEVIEYGVSVAAPGRKVTHEFDLPTI